MPARPTRIALAVALAALVAQPGAASARTAAGDRLDVVVTVVPREPRPDVFVLKGRVTPAYAEGEAVLQRRSCPSCAWFAFERFETDRDSRFRLRVPALRPGERKVCYRVKVPRSSEVRTALSEHHCIAPIGASA